MVQFVTASINLALQPELFITNTKKLYLQCKTSLGAMTITLPRISVSGSTWGFEIYINDVDGNAGTNNITIAPNGADKINGSNSSIVISSNSATASLEVVGVNAWEYYSSSNSGGLSGIEDGTFSITADGSTGLVNGAPVTPTDNLDGTWTMTIPTTSQLALGHFGAQCNVIVDPSNFKYCSSYGKDDGTKADCLSTLNQKVTGTLYTGAQEDFGDSINVADRLGDGWLGVVQNITSGSYQILWTQNGSGLDVSVQWHGVMG